jgi:hypothetical protein
MVLIQRKHLFGVSGCKPMNNQRKASQIGQDCGARWHIAGASQAHFGFVPGRYAHPILDLGQQNFARLWH